jgi:predicted ATP-dependent endonuclease of OLD family
MKINSLKIEGFNVLDNDFFIDFSNSSNLSILIGKNGSGKSSILEVVGLIFKSLYKGVKPSFKFVIDYELYEQKIGIQYNDESFTIRVNTNVYYLSDTDYLKDRGIKLLPDNIIAYYSGSNIRLKNIFNFGRYIQSPFLYVEDKHFKLILLTLLSSKIQSHKDFLATNFYVNDNNNFEFNLGIQLFPKKLIEQIREIDENFIFHLSEMLTIQDLIPITIQKISKSDNQNAEIVLKKIDKIWQDISASEILKYCLQMPYRFMNNMFYFSFEPNDLVDFMYKIGGEIDFFKNLLDLTSKGILKNVDFEFFKNNNLVDYTAFSEGERQLITVIGLKELISGESNLFLLDEPDTYLHPSWQNLLVNKFLENQSNYTFVTTHSANILKNISKKHIFILKNINNKIQVIEPPKSTFGRDVNSILNEAMEVDERNSEMDKLLDEYFTIISERDFNNAILKKKEILQLALEHEEECFGYDEPEFIRANAIIERMKVLGR